MITRWREERAAYRPRVAAQLLLRRLVRVRIRVRIRVWVWVWVRVAFDVVATSMIGGSQTW